MKLTFLGTGTSFGIPVVGCDCPTCTSTDPRDARTRHGALVRMGETTILVDTPPELRQQLVAAGVERVDAVWYTHVHADHVHGIDDLRIFTVRYGDLPAYVPAEYVDHLGTYFNYIFDTSVVPVAGSSKPRVTLHPFSGEEPVLVAGHEFTPLPLPHGPVTVYGFRVGGLGYVTDAKRLTPQVVQRLEGVDVLVLNALWFGRPHASHFNVEEAVEAARNIGARRTFLTHLTHRVRHEELLGRLPPGIEPAFDGLTIEVSDG
ncbi:MAG: MBL fold metallo-hydrolase [Gemmatimonadota bacterium]